MRAFSILATVALAACSDIPKLPEPPDPFALILERTDSEWSATCEAGCRWQTLTFECSSDCDMVLDQTGVFIGSMPEQLTGFAFSIEPTPDGWEARSLQGTRWLSLTWSCGPGPCSARVDEGGVSSIAAAGTSP